MDYKKKYLKYKKKYLNLKGGNGDLIPKPIPIYRFVKDDDPNIFTSGKISKFNFENGSCILYQNAVYKLPCDPKRNNDEHEYLSTKPYGDTTNIVGFLKYIDEPFVNRNSMLDPKDYFKYSSMFRIRTVYEKLNRLVFITNYKVINNSKSESESESELKIVVGENTVFKNIKCPETGRGTNDVIVSHRSDNLDYIRGKQATCDHDDYPKKGCPSEPVVTNLGSLMPYPNDKEINFIGSGDIRGILIIAVASANELYHRPSYRPYSRPSKPSHGEFQYLASKNMINNEEIINDLLNAIQKEPELLTNIFEEESFKNYNTTFYKFDKSQDKKNKTKQNSL
jgi:hypothetical protein